MEDVREKHGTRHEEQHVTLTEREDCIAITTNITYQGHTVFLTPNEARYIAARLYRLARRVDSRL